MMVIDAQRILWKIEEFSRTIRRAVQHNNSRLANEWGASTTQRVKCEK